MVAAQAAMRYAVSVFCDHAAVRGLIEASLNASSRWDRPPAPMPFIDIGYGALPQYIAPPPPAFGELTVQEEEDDGRGEPAVLLRLVEDGLQWALKWGEGEEEGLAGECESLATTLHRVREALMLSLHPDLFAYSMPLPC